MSQRANTGYMDGYWGLVCGHVEEGENFRRAAEREAMEEVGVEVLQKDMEIVHMMDRQSRDYACIEAFITIDTWKGQIHNNEPHKCGGLEWFPQDALPKKVIPYIEEALNHIKLKKPFSEFGWN